MLFVVFRVWLVVVVVVVVGGGGWVEVGLTKQEPPHLRGGEIFYK